MDIPAPRPLAVVTGASSGIGLQLALRAVEHGYDLLLAADTPLDPACALLRSQGARGLEAVQADLATRQGVDAVCDALAGRPVEALLANAGHGLGGGFLAQDFAQVQHVIDTNITGTLYLLHRLVPAMRERGRGRVLVTGSIAGFQPGSFHAVYNGTKAFIDSFALALRNELGRSGVTLTLLMPGPTDTDFFERAGLMDTRVGADMHKDDPAEVARLGFDAMLHGEADVVTGWRSRLQVAASKVLPAQAVAQAHRKLAEPGSAGTPSEPHQERQR